MTPRPGQRHRVQKSSLLVGFCLGKVVLREPGHLPLLPAMIILYESAQFELLHDSGCDCLYATWLGPHQPDLVLANYEVIFKFIGATGSTKLLNDALLDQDGWEEATAWLAQECFPHLARQGITVVAWVLPRQPQAFHATHHLLSQLKQPLIATFEDAELAYNWLHQPPASNITGAHH